MDSGSREEQSATRSERAMKLVFVATALLSVVPGVTRAQSASVVDPEMAVAAAIVDSLGSGPIAFDSRFSGTATRRSEERANAIARLLHADARRGDSVLVCATRSPRSCSLGAYATLVSMSKPIFAKDHSSAVVTVTTTRTTNLPRIPLEAQDVQYMVARQDGAWRVAKRRTTRIT
jgi:hypothetical protein